jgi:hypothetical protein
MGKDPTRQVNPARLSRAGVEDNSDSIRKLKCVDVPSWRVATKKELLLYYKRLGGRRKRKRRAKTARRIMRQGSYLAVRQNLSPVDVYSYLRARFGQPNGFQNFLRKDDSNNLVHWDFNLKAGKEDVYISGASREIHFLLSEKLTDQDWRDLIINLKSDYKRVGLEKSAFQKTLEKWTIFPNKFVEIAGVCADLHSDILDNIGGFQSSKPSGKSKWLMKEHFKRIERLGKRANILNRSCLELSLITPVLAEAFINMAILVFCKRAIRENRRQFEAFIRADIDTKIFDLAYKCEGFARPIDQTSDGFKNFKRIMDQRNNRIHGNVDPKRDGIETVYFEGRRPLFEKSGDHLGEFFQALERQYNPHQVIKNYEDMHLFLLDIVDCLEPGGAKTAFLAVMDDPYPGYDFKRHITGVLLPHYIAAAYFGPIRYDDELNVDWSKEDSRS